MAPWYLSIIFLVFAVYSSAAPSPSSTSLSKRLLTKSSLAQVPRGWNLHGTPPRHHTIKLRIGLRQSNFAELERALFQVSDPSHIRYGLHLSKEEVKDLIAPHPETLTLVESWLASHGIDIDSLDRSTAGDWIAVVVPIHQAESMLGADYRTYKHESTGAEIVRVTSYRLPEHLHDHIDVVHPTTMFGGTLRPTVSRTRIRQRDTGAAVDASCSTLTTLKCLQDLYNTAGYKPRAPSKNAYGITGYAGQFANLADLKLFYQQYLPEATNFTFKEVLINGGQNSQNLSQAGVEADFDMQYAGGLTFPTQNIFYSTGGSPPYIPDANSPSNTNEPYQDWLDYMSTLQEDEIPQTIATSYADDEESVPPDYAIRACQGFAQLGARGVSLLFGSGDGGVGSTEGSACFSNDGKNTTVFLPSFPATCPYVTVVGGTTGIPEVAVEFSGGGFSYQSEVVNSYLQGLGTTYAGLFNSTGRAYPDVAAFSTNFTTIYEGQSELLYGTSAATPTFGAVISLANDALIAANKPPLGFLNPWLYSGGYKALNDITSGSNPGCGTAGFSAGVGWDPVTGFGTPDFQKILAALGLGQ